MVFRRSDMEDVVEQVVELAEQSREAMEEHFQGVPMGMTRVDDETFAAFMDGLLANDTMVDIEEIETGKVQRSVWLYRAELALTVNGAKMLDRYDRIRGVS